MNQLECAENILKAYDGKEALNMINASLKEKRPAPSIIFLDLNMPGMNGWEFLEEYKKLSADQKSKTILALVTTSLNPDDLERAKQNPDVKEFCNKFLTKKMLNEILHKYFPENF